MSKTIIRLRKIATGEIFAWDPVLARNPKMEVVHVEDTTSSSPPDGDTTGAASTGTGSNAGADTDKDVLIEQCRKAGIECDRRMSVSSLQARLQAVAAEG